MLSSFISSFAVLGELATQSETRVFELYLRSRWGELEGQIGKVRADCEGIALMRLILQVQSLPLQKALIEAWALLSDKDRSLLSFEMSLTVPGSGSGSGSGSGLGLGLGSGSGLGSGLVLESLRVVAHGLRLA